MNRYMGLFLAEAREHLGAALELQLALEALHEHLHVLHLRLHRKLALALDELALEHEALLREVVLLIELLLTEL